LHQPAIVTEVTMQAAVLQRADAVADVVADPVRRVEQGIVPVGVEQGRERMGLVMVGEFEDDIRPEPMIAEESVGAEHRFRVGGAAKLAMDQEITQLSVEAEPLLNGIVVSPVERMVKIQPWK
jgi:hypothetical protein